MKKTNNVISVLNQRFSDISVLAVIVTIIAVFTIIIASGKWKKPQGVIYSDVQEYYTYLPAFFIYHDLTAKTVPSEYFKYFWLGKSPNGKKVFRFTMGLSFLYAPFFFMAQLYAQFSGGNISGFSSPYQFSLLMSSFTFLLIGLIFLRKILLLYYKKYIVAITLIAIVFGTNLLLYSSVRAPMAHTYNFALFSMFIYFTIKWFRTPYYRYALAIGLLTGLISLIRPSNIIIVLFFIFYQTVSWKSFTAHISVFAKQYKQFLVTVFAAFLVWVPQLIYWKIYTGSFLFYSYGKEGFFFNNPQIINILFSYRNGWLLYSPLMIIALTGIVVLYFKRKDFFFPVLIFTLLNIYILSSWWCWWFVGFGNRAFIDSYAILAIPFAEITALILSRRSKIKYLYYPVLLFLVFLNGFQTWQFTHDMGHYDGMTKSSYRYLFLNDSPKGKQYKLFHRPDYKKAKKGIYEFGK